MLKGPGDIKCLSVLLLLCFGFCSVQDLPGHHLNTKVNNTLLSRWTVPYGFAFYHILLTEGAGKIVNCLYFLDRTCNNIFKVPHFFQFHFFYSYLFCRLSNYVQSNFYIVHLDFILSMKLLFIILAFLFEDICLISSVSSSCCRRVFRIVQKSFKIVATVLNVMLFL